MKNKYLQNTFFKGLLISAVTTTCSALLIKYIRNK